MSALLSFTQFTDFASYFSFPLPFSVYLGLVVVALGILLCVSIGIVICVRRCCCGGRMQTNPDEFASTRQIIDVEMATKGQQATKQKSSRYKAKLSLRGNVIQEEASSHGYEDIEDLDQDDYENVRDRLDDSDSDDFDYENLRSGV
ncbi:uncharacterized protein LOC133194984 [Saccostrea echinata]|uniref:uncharacterized protein LOC133194984 n=1 Tax=Saccostrea echinata TaxID=191078 RepID=UPI002A833B14|nr:uncharacterized protein LOC133194984 [Saccostrea echinata]